MHSGDSWENASQGASLTKSGLAVTLTFDLWSQNPISIDVVNLVKFPQAVYRHGVNKRYAFYHEFTHGQPNNSMPPGTILTVVETKKNWETAVNMSLTRTRTFNSSDYNWWSTCSAVSQQPSEYQLDHNNYMQRHLSNDTINVNQPGQLLHYSLTSFG